MIIIQILIRRVNAFTALLAKATDDPSLRQNAVFAKEVEKKPAVVQTIEKEEKKPAVTDAVIKEEKKPDQVMQTAAKPDENKTGCCKYKRPKGRLTKEFYKSKRGL